MCAVDETREWIRGRARLAALVLVLALAAMLWRVWQSPGTRPALSAEAALPLVSVASPGRSAVSSAVTFTGTIRARHDMPVGAEGEGGRIVAVRVEVGDRVHRGQVLAALDTSVIAPQVERLAASLLEARSTAGLRQAEYRRAQGMAASGALSAEEIERRRAAAVAAEAQVKVAEAQLLEGRARLARMQIRAPADGLVLERHAEIGQTAVPGGAPLFRLSRDGQVEMVGQVAEQDLPRLAVGQPAEVSLTGIEVPFAGHVRLLGAVIDPQTRLGEVRVALQAHPDLRPGAFARGEVAVASTERPVLPQTAVLADARGTYVYLVNGEGRVERRDVRVAGTGRGGMVIAAGLEGGERVVTVAGAFLREGEKVRLAPVPEAPSTGHAETGS